MYKGIYVYPTQPCILGNSYGLTVIFTGNISLVLLKLTSLFGHVRCR